MMSRNKKVTECKITKTDVGNEMKIFDINEIQYLPTE